MPTFAADVLLRFCRDLFSTAGLSDEDAATLADSVVDSSLAGHDSHGLMLVGRYVKEIRDETVSRTCRLRFERETANTAHVDARNAQGHIAGRKVTQLAIDKALEHGVAAVTVYNIGHVGRLGTYVEMAARQNCVALATINNHGGGTWMVPFGGSDRRLSPNPFGIGAPTGGEWPLVLDVSCTNVAVGKCIVATTKGESIPLGWIVDHEGNPTTDPSKLIGPPAGALLPVGGELAGHKGYALGFMMDVLAGALSKAGCSRDTEFRHQNGLFLTVLCIENFVDLSDFTDEVDRLIAWVKASPRKNSDQDILYPGEFEARMRKERTLTGIPVPDVLCNTLRQTAESLGVPNTPGL